MPNKRRMMVYISPAMADALADKAVKRGVSKSHLVREALAKALDSP